uniref:Chemosensory protein 5 n=1 Tax=Anopheles christyi TaxID=43041 RepID=A0A182JP34_9DIPT
MRKVWLLASAVLAFLNFVKSQEVARTLYSTRYDNLDIDTILGSNRLVTNYVDCLLSRKPCPPEGKDLKRILPEALRTKCARCSPIQKENALKIITRLYYDYPDQYRALRERWDPSGEYHRRFEEYLRGLQFNQIGGNAGTAGGSGVGNTIESGGNDRPVRNDLDRQPATQSSNVQAIVIDPTLAGQPIGNVNTLPPSPTPLPPLAAVVPAVTERPRPPAPVAQILFPTTTDTSNTSNTSTTTTHSDTTTTSTSTSNSGLLELTSSAPSAPVPSNTVTSSSNLISPSGGTVLALNSSDPILPPPEAGSEQDSTATAGPVVPVPVNYYLNITNGGSLTLWMIHVTLGDTGH